MTLKFPILMVHGMGFRDYKHLNYWGRIPKTLSDMGCQIYYGNQDSNAAIETNAAKVAERIQEVLTETKSEKINIIAHSKGGLDVRAAICEYQLDDVIASVTTISTPHHGSKTVDALLRFPDIFVKIVGACTDLVFKFLGDKSPDSYQVFHSFTTTKAKEFNLKYPASDKIFCQSYAFVMKNIFSDLFLWFPYLVIRLAEGENDGLLCPDSVKWEHFRGIVRSNSHRGISHCDEVDMRRHRFTGKDGDGVSDIVEFYRNVVRELAERGY